MLNTASPPAAMDVASAEVALRQAQVDLTAKVRAGFFAVLAMPIVSRLLDHLKVEKAVF